MKKNKASGANRIGGLALAATGKIDTAKARSAFLARFETAVDPEGKLSPTERRKRASFALRAHMVRIARLPRSGQGKRRA